MRCTDGRPSEGPGDSWPGAVEHQQVIGDDPEPHPAHAAGRRPTRGDIFTEQLEGHFHWTPTQEQMVAAPRESPDVISALPQSGSSELEADGVAPGDRRGVRCDRDRAAR